MSTTSLPPAGVTTQGGDGVTTEGGEGGEGVDVTPQPLVSEKSLTATSSTALVSGETPHEVTTETLVATPGPAASTTAEVVTMTPSGSPASSTESGVLVTPGQCVASASCQGRCGGGSHDDCWCDDHCDHFGDCCCDLATLCSAEVTSHHQFIGTTMYLPTGDGPGRDVFRGRELRGEVRLRL